MCIRDRNRTLSPPVYVGPIKVGSLWPSVYTGFNAMVQMCYSLTITCPLEPLFHVGIQRSMFSKDKVEALAKLAACKSKREQKLV